MLWKMDNFADLGTIVPKKSCHHLGLSPMRPNEFWTGPDDELLGHKPLVINVVVAGSVRLIDVEEEEEGTGVTSDVLTVEGEDSAPTGHLKRNDTETVTIPQYWYNKTKQHTHTDTPDFFVLSLLGREPK